MSKELVQAMDILEEEKGISREVIKEALEQALVLAYKKKYDQAQNVEVVFDAEKGTVKVFSVKEVVETNLDDTLEVSLEEARKINPHYEIGDKIRFEVTPKNFGLLAIQTAKHVILQRLREAERELIYNEFIDYEDEILTGTVERVDGRTGTVYIDLGRVEAAMPTREQIPGETFEMDERVKVYVTKVDKTTKGPQIIVSRAHQDFLKRLFEQEVPEIYDGIVEIMAIAREAGDRSKVAVRSRNPQIDAVGTCVGQGGARVNAIVSELNGENMDIIEYDEDSAIFINNSMSPAEVLDVKFEEKDDQVNTIVVVPDHQLSLAIGKKGQNARLAARLTNHKIDIKSETAYQEYVQEQIKAQLEAGEAVEALEEATLEVEWDIDSVSDVDEAIALDGANEFDDDLMDLQDLNEQNYSPQMAEEAIASAEIDVEQDYNELQEETTYDSENEYSSEVELMETDKGLDVDIWLETNDEVLDAKEMIDDAQVDSSEK